MDQKLLTFKSPWFWAIPVFACVMMLIIGLSGSNQSLFLTLNNLFYFQPEAIWINITLFGDAAMVLILLLPLVSKRPDIILKTFIAALITTLIIHTFKEFLSIPRPPSVYSADIFHQLGHQFAHSSFPSGHAAAAFTLASVIIFYINNTKLRFFMLFYASIISLSRIASGVHWPMDILAGMLFGWIAAYLSIRLFKSNGEGTRTQRFTSILLLMIAIHLIFLHDAGDKEARFLEILTPVICFILSLKGLKSLFLDPILLRVKQ